MYISTNFSAAQIVNRTVYFSLVRCNGLFAYDIDRKRTRFISFFEGDPLNIKGAHLFSVKYGDKILFIPYEAKRISVLNLENESLSYIEINKDKPGTFFNGFVNKDELWLIPQCLEKHNDSHKNICVLNLKDFTIEEKHVITETGLNLMRSFFSLGACSNKNKLYVAVYGTNNVISVDMDVPENIEVINLSNCEGISTVDYIDDSLWVSEVTCGDIKNYDLDGTLIKTMHNDLCYGVNRPYRAIRKYGEIIYVFPNRLDSILKINDYGNVYRLPIDIRRKVDNMSCVGQIIENDNKMILCPAAFDKLVNIEENGTITCTEIEFREEEMIDINKHYYDSGVMNICTEREVSLSDYIEFVNGFC